MPPLTEQCRRVCRNRKAGNGLSEFRQGNTIPVRRPEPGRAGHTAAAVPGQSNPYVPPKHRRHRARVISSFAEKSIADV